MREEQKVSEAQVRFNNRPSVEKDIKESLEYMRNYLFPIDIPETAQCCGVAPAVIYNALLKQPIEKTDAEKILAHLSTKHHITPALTLHDVDISIYDDFFGLYLVCASGEKVEANYHLVYAQDPQHAKILLRHWIKSLATTHPTITINGQREGIKIFGGSFIPGYINPRISNG